MSILKNNPMSSYAPPYAPQVFGPSPNRRDGIYAVGGHLYSSPEDDCRKILDWFTRNPMLSDEQAVHALKIGNFRERIAHLRKRGYAIDGVGVLMEAIASRLHTSMVYGLHHFIPVSVTIPYISPYNNNSYAMANSIVATYLGLPNFEVAELICVERDALWRLLKKMQSTTR